MSALRRNFINRKNLFTSFILLALIFTTACQNLTNAPSNNEDIPPVEIVEVKNVVSDDLELKINSAFECVTMIAHLADFDEYYGNNSDGAISRYYAYFKPYLKQPKTKTAIKHFKSLRNTYGFSYDAVASLATAMNPEVTISFSYLSGNGNYGCSFREGDKIFFEPKYWSHAMQYFDPGLIVLQATN